jgi:hypothetical protein
MNSKTLIAPEQVQVDAPQYAGLNATDGAFIATLRREFNAQPRDERIRTGRFMAFEAVMELLRERQHAAASLDRIDLRISRVLEAERNKS